MNQQGLSPKVGIPTLLLLVVGVVLIATGDKNTGVTLLLAAAGVGTTGYAVPHAGVGEKGHVGDGSDAQLSATARKHLKEIG